MNEPTRADAIEVFLTWGVGAAGCVLAVSYVRAGGRFAVGEAEGCDAILPVELLGVLRADVVTWDRAPSVVPPRGAQVWIDGRPAPAERTLLRAGEVVDVSCGELTIRARLVARREEWAASPENDRSFGLPRGLVVSALTHVVSFLFLALALSSRAEDREITPEQMVTMRTLLAASERVPPDARAERSAVERVARHEAPSASHAPSRGPVEATVSAAATRSEATVSPRIGAPAGPPSRAAERAEAAGFGVVGLVQALKVDPGEPVPWKDALASLGAHEAAIRTMFGDPPIGSFEAGGLALSGTGEGGGGKGHGVDLGDPEPDDGQWHSPSWSKAIESLPPVPYHPLPGRSSAGPVRSRADMLADAGLGQDAIRRVVHANGGRVRDCYQAGLRRNPSLAGRVIVGFTIGDGGAVAYAKDEGSDLPDPAVRECIVKSFYALGFPSPKGGPVTVKYPFSLKPGE